MIGHRDSVAEIALCILLCRHRHLAQGLCHLIGHNICCNECYRERENCREQEHLEHRPDRLVQRIRILRSDDRAAKLAGCHYRLNAYKMRALVHSAERARFGISAAAELRQAWRGVSPQTGERVTAVSAPLLYNGKLVGILRYVTSMRLVDRQVIILTLIAVILSVSILILVYLSNIYFVRSIVGPVKNITGIARRIAGGSYGIQVEKKFDDEVGDLTDAINDMSLRIKQAESMKQEFISSVSHELRTPLTAITGWAETIMSGEARDEGDVRKGMSIIASEARRLSGMVEELLEFSRIEDGRFTLSIEPMDIKAELEDAVYTYHEFLAAEGIAVYHTDCEEEFAPIPGDPDRLRQVFCNLLDNAAKHGGAGKRIDTAIYPDDGDVVITVRDYGPGIPPDELPNVKYKFYKGSSTARGSGIGLAVCEEIISRHNGELTISNADDEAGGCLVEIRLPTGT